MLKRKFSQLIGAFRGGGYRWILVIPAAFAGLLLARGLLFGLEEALDSIPLLGPLVKTPIMWCMKWALPPASAVLAGAASHSDQSPLAALIVLILYVLFAVFALGYYHEVDAEHLLGLAVACLSGCSSFYEVMSMMEARNREASREYEP